MSYAILASAICNQRLDCASLGNQELRALCIEWRFSLTAGAHLRAGQIIMVMTMAGDCGLCGSPFRLQEVSQYDCIYGSAHLQSYVH